MGLFGKRGNKTGCTHPVTSVVWLREDKTDRYTTTGLLCTLCGQRLPLPSPKDNRPAP